MISGSLVTDAAGVRPSLDTKGVLEGVQPNPPPTSRPEPEPEQLTPESLVTADQVGAALGGTWTQGQTSGNTGGDGLVFTCQGGRYADPAGVAALVRTFKQDPGPDAKAEPSTAGQSAEVSADAAAGETTYETTAGWYAGCMSPRMQLLTTHKVKGVGDDAMLFTLRDWNEPAQVQVVGVARTGAVTTTTSADPPGRGVPGPGAERGPARQRRRRPLRPAGRRHLRRRARAQGRATDGDRPGARAAQRGRPATGHEGDRAVGRHRAGGRLDQPGRDPLRRDRLLGRWRQPRPDPLVPHPGRRPAAGVRPHPDRRCAAERSRREAFVADVRRKLTTCPDRDLATQVDKVHDTSEGARELAVWRLTVEVSDDRTVTFLMGIIRNGTAVSQLTFVPADGVVMGGDPFIALGMRAQERLLRLGKPKA